MIDQAPLGRKSAVRGIKGGAKDSAVLAGMLPFLARLAAEGVVVICALFTAEMAVTAVLPATWTNNSAARIELERRHAARRLHLPFDSRSISAVVEDLKRQGVEAFSGIGRAWPLEEAARERLPAGFFPLSHLSNATIVECNEGGKYLVYRTDEYGFNNPRGLIASGDVDVAIVGESLALGYCVEPGRSTADLVRRAYPRTANFGLADTRNLAQLASFREYVEPLHPPVVLWFVNLWYAALGGEADHPVLSRYFDPSYRQDLPHRQDEVDAAVREIGLPLVAAAERQLEHELGRARAERFGHVLTLPQMRNGLNPLKRKARAPAAADLSLLERCLRLARDATAGWGGRFIVVVLPNYQHARGGAVELATHRRIVQIVTSLGIELVDGATLIASKPDPAALFLLRMQNHPNDAGHALLAERIVAELTAHPRAP